MNNRIKNIFDVSITVLIASCAVIILLFLLGYFGYCIYDSFKDPKNWNEDINTAKDYLTCEYDRHTMYRVGKTILEYREGYPNKVYVVEGILEYRPMVFVEFEIDGCQYLGFRCERYDVFTITHKGNCKSAQHKH